MLFGGEVPVHQAVRARGYYAQTMNIADPRAGRSGPANFNQDIPTEDWKS